MAKVTAEFNFPLEKGKTLRQEFLNFEYDIIRAALKLANGNITEAGRYLGMKRTTLSMRLLALDIDASFFRTYD